MEKNAFKNSSQNREAAETKRDSRSNTQFKMNVDEPGFRVWLHIVYVAS